MAKGEGKYDHICTMARLMTHAEAIALIVINGEHGAGFSVQSLRGDITAALPDVLERIARQMRADGSTSEGGE